MMAHHPEHDHHHVASETVSPDIPLTHAKKNVSPLLFRTDRSPEGGGHACGRPASHEVSLLAIVPEVLELGEGSVKAQDVGLALVVAAGGGR